MITIFQSRYHGGYEGGLWVAFYSKPQDVPTDAIAGDTLASRWWIDHEHEVGVGETPDEALADLYTKRGGSPPDVSPN